MVLKSRIVCAVSAAMLATTGAAVAEPDPVAQPVTQPAPEGAPTIGLVEWDGGDRPSGEVGTQAASLPFDFTFDFETTLASRNFWPSDSGKACVSLRGTGSTDPNWPGKEILVEMWDADGIDTQVGAPVRYTLDGSYYGYCWSALYTNHEHYFKLVKEWGDSRVYGDGWASTS